ncbi:MAG: A/G-specific adenine glycosylase [Phycisphaerales bacterium]
MPPRRNSPAAKPPGRSTRNRRVGGADRADHAAVMIGNGGDAGRDRAITAALTRWFAASARDLPWRATPRNPYHALVAEAMLQQTQVSRVIDFFHRFLARFPTVAALAAASEAEVLALWSGLGYYRRAKNLHAAAKTVVADYAGRIPDTAEALATLPGIGPYTAGAIASIVFDQPAPLVDGNVLRVLQRLEARDDFENDRIKATWAWQRAGELVQASISVGGPAAFNEGLMELGATVCLAPPAQPQCLLCPLRDHCRAHAEGLTDRIPSPRERATQKAAHCLVLVIRDKCSRILVEQRPHTGMWAGMWQCPTLDLDRAPTPADAADFARLKSADPASLKPLGDFTHNTTHRRLHFVAIAADAVPCKRQSSTRVWLDANNADAIAKLGISNAQRRVLMIGCPDPRRVGR